MFTLLKKTYSFKEAIEALKEGKKIRRKFEPKGYLKKSEDKFATYWIDDRETSEYCLFTIDDVFAEDWLIER